MGEIPPNQIDNATIMGIITVLILIRAVLAVLNTGGIQYIVRQLQNESYQNLRIIIGMVNDKDISGVLAMLPQNAVYYFTRASIPRALPEERLYELAIKAGLTGKCYPSVQQAVEAAKKESRPDDLIFVGGSTFIVADLLKTMLSQQ